MYSWATTSGEYTTEEDEEISQHTIVKAGEYKISFLAQYSEFETLMCSITVKCYQPSW